MCMCVHVCEELDVKTLRGVNVAGNVVGTKLGCALRDATVSQNFVTLGKIALLVGRVKRSMSAC